MAAGGNVAQQVVARLAAPGDADEEDAIVHVDANEERDGNDVGKV